MTISLASVSPRASSKSQPLEALTAEFVERASRMARCEAQIFSTEAALLAATARQPGRAAAHLLLLDSRGELVSSEEFAVRLGRLRDNATQRLMLAIGPHDGWSPAAHARADGTLSLGRITLPHELARAVLAEQIYRALTILAGHPYHSGH